MDELAKAAEDRARFIMEHRERFVEAWVAETGIHPSEAQIVITETWEGPVLRTTITVQRQAPFVAVESGEGWSEPR